MTYNLDRFKIAQEKSHLKALFELKNGKKQGHWMWFTFPQIAGLGMSSTSKLYEIVNLKEAYEYLKDELLSARLIELTETTLYDVEGLSAEAIFGFTDTQKFRSSMTLFYAVISTYIDFENEHRFRCFENAVIKYFNGALDEQTLTLLELPHLSPPQIATSTSWKIVPIKKPQSISINLQFSKVDFFELTKGVIPQDMEERWFVYYENQWLYFHRSWTGFGFYKAKLNRTMKGYSIDEFWAERNNVETTPEKEEYDREMFRSIIELVILKKPLND